MQEPGSQSETPAQPQPSTFEPPSYSAPLSDFPSTPIPSPTGEMQTQPWGTAVLGNNDSGSGATAVLPEELKGFNWGSCLMTWIWSIGMQFWLGLLILPVSWIAQAILKAIHLQGLSLLMNLAFMVAFGVKGNEWAWQYRRWESVEHFKSTQRVWAIWGIVLFALIILLFVVLFVVLGAAIMAMIAGGGKINPGSFQPGTLPR